MFKRALHKGFTQPVGVPDLSRFRVVDMYTKCTETSMKQAIISCFCMRCSPLQVVIATKANGMGLDSPFVRQVIHWGPLDTIEDYVQETGRCVRKLVALLLLFANADQQYTKKRMIEYCKNMNDADKITAPSTKCTCCDEILQLYQLLSLLMDCHPYIFCHIGMTGHVHTGVDGCSNKPTHF